MNLYIFVITVFPTPHNKLANDIMSAQAHVWLLSKDLNSAKQQATQHLKDALWNVMGFEYEFEIPSDLFHALRIEESSLYREALKHGIATDYMTCPKIKHPIKSHGKIIGWKKY